MWIVIGIINGFVALAGALYALVAIAYLDVPYRGGWTETGLALALIVLLGLGPVAAFIVGRRAGSRALAFAWIITLVIGQVIIEQVSGHRP